MCTMGGVITVSNEMETQLATQLSCGIVLVLRAIMLYQINLLLLMYIVCYKNIQSKKKTPTQRYWL